MNIFDSYKRTKEVLDKFNSSGCTDKDLLINQINDLTLSCDLFDRIIDGSIDGLFITDENAKILKVSKGYEQITGLKGKDLLGCTTDSLVEDGKISVSSSRLAIQKKGTVTINQDINTGKNIMVTSNPLFDKDNNIIITVSNIRDMSTLNRLRHEIIAKDDLVNKYKQQLDVFHNQQFTGSNIIAEDNKTVNLLHMARKVSEVDTTVILLGESGVGKEEIAKFIYKNSRRKDKPFIKINCGAIPETLLESELFGYEKGAFTGANKEGKIGLFEAANTGTVFLDEIGELPMNMQVKILRVLQEMEIERIGRVAPIKIDVRIIAATNCNLEEMVEKKIFREDLYYRLNVIPITIPPLRERKDDIIPLINHFVKLLNKKYNLNKIISQDAYRVLLDYAWPGNVRQLKNIIERAMILSKNDYIQPFDLSIKMKDNLDNRIIGQGLDLKEILEQIEFEYINKAYDKCKNVRDAAKALNMKMPTFVRKRIEYRKKFAHLHET